MTATLPAQFAQALYQRDLAPWDIGAPQPVIRQLAALGAVRGHTLDAGCGTGWHSVEFARAGASVVGVDASLTAVARARRNARGAGVDVKFELGDVTTRLADHADEFETVCDIKLFDNLEAGDRPRYLAALHGATAPGARLILVAFGPGDINGHHSHELEEFDFEHTLPANGFGVDYMGDTTYLIRAKGWTPICDACPRTLQPGTTFLHIPAVLVLATRR